MSLTSAGSTAVPPPFGVGRGEAESGGSESRSPASPSAAGGETTHWVAPSSIVISRAEDAAGDRESASGELGATALLSVYGAMVSDGSARFDPHQYRALEELERLRGKLVGGSDGQDERDLVGCAARDISLGDGEESESSTPWPLSLGIFSKMFSSGSVQAVKRRLEPPPPKGVYLHGGVGCGKTFCMDLFYDIIPSDAISKQKVHFHKFMLGLHKQVRST